MVNNYTIINRTNNHLSPAFIEYKTPTSYDVGNESPDLVQAQKGGKLDRLMESQPCPLGNWVYFIWY